MSGLIRANKYYIGLFLIFVLLGGWVLTMIQKGDVVLWLDVHHTPLLDIFFKYATRMGEGLVVIALIGFVGLYRFRHFVYGALAMGVSTGIIQSLKHFVFPHMDRPKVVLAAMDLHFVEGVHVNSHFSFPSGHSASAFTLFTVMALSTKNKALGVLWFFLALFVAGSRMYLKQHFFMDIYTGGIIGFVTAVVFYLVIQRYQNKEWANKRLIG
jgi:membrane-associated phospholipid phosphatase